MRLTKPELSTNLIDEWLEGLENDPPELLSENQAKFVIQKVREILQEENNVQPIPYPVTIAGDIHGQFDDLLQLFHIGKRLPETNYLFLGDYIDRGFNSVETFLYLLLLKLRWPAKITLLRGNHESRQITQVYGFYDECIRKYGNSNVWRYCTELFDYLTLAAIVDGQIFCVHGGLSPSIRLIDQLRLIHRVQEIPHNGAFGDSVWSDPDPNVETWAVSPRGAGWLFGGSVVNEFCHLNDVDLIARAHQLALEGYQFVFPNENLVTVWSAPNYCYRCGNVAAVMQLSENGERSFLIFKQKSNCRDKAVQRVSLPYFL